MNTDFEQQLRGAMERFTDDVRVPPGLALKAYRQRQKRRMTGRAATAAGTATVVAGSLAVAGAAGAFGSARGGPAQTTYTAYVVRHVEHALAAPRLGHLVEADRTIVPGRHHPPAVPVRTCWAASALPGPARRGRPGYTLRWIYHASLKVSSFTASGQPGIRLGSQPGAREPRRCSTATTPGGPRPRRAAAWADPGRDPPAASAAARSCSNTGAGQRLAGLHPVPAGLRRLRRGGQAGDRRGQHHQDHRDGRPVHVLGGPGDLPAGAGPCWGRARPTSAGSRPSRPTWPRSR